jgi:hypothetical protein
LASPKLFSTASSICYLIYYQLCVRKPNNFPVCQAVFQHCCHIIPSFIPYTGHCDVSAQVHHEAALEAIHTIIFQSSGLSPCAFTRTTVIYGHSCATGNAKLKRLKGTNSHGIYEYGRAFDHR